MPWTVDAADVKARWRIRASQDVPLQWRFPLHGERQRSQDRPWKTWLHAAHRVAWRMDGKTVVRAAMGAFVCLRRSANTERDDLGEIDLGGFTPTTGGPARAGRYSSVVPVQSLSAGPGSIVGKKFGRNTNLGSAVSSTSTNSARRSAIASTSRCRDNCRGSSSWTLRFTPNYVSHDQYSLN